MSIFSKLFGPSKAVEVSVCDFCERLVKSDTEQIVLIKGNDKLTDFEQKTGFEHKRPASRIDKDGELLFFGCNICLQRYVGLCSKCKAQESDLTHVRLRSGNRGKEVDLLLCGKCLTELADEL